MSIEIVLSGAEELRANLWSVAIDPKEIRSFPNTGPGQGPYNIIYTNVSPTLNTDKLSIPLSAIQSILLTDAKCGLVISSAREILKEISDNQEGDQKFKNGLSQPLKELGETLLVKIRTLVKGRLKYHPKSKKYVETPNNFWTVRIQSRDLSLRITVYGYPESFLGVPDDLELKKDMTSYSSFKIKNIQQIDDAISIILQARAKKAIKDPSFRTSPSLIDDNGA